MFSGSQPVSCCCCLYSNGYLIHTQLIDVSWCSDTHMDPTSTWGQEEETCCTTSISQLTGSSPPYEGMHTCVRLPHAVTG
jgi:hypothetical protein